MCWNCQNRACFSKLIDLRGHMARFTLKMNVFPSISLEMPEMCVETIRNRVHFSMIQSIWGVTWLGLLWKINVFPSISFGNPINVCWNPQNRACFSKMINLIGHMPRFTPKNEHFPMYLLQKCHKYVLKLSEQGSCFPSWSIWGVTWLGLLENGFPIYLLRNARNVCCNHQERVHFSNTINLRGHMARFTWKINVFPSISLECP